MKNIKKMMALIIVAMMVVATMNIGTFAAPGDLKSQGTITVNGLKSGTEETVKYYKVLEWDQANATLDNGGWKFTSMFANVDDPNNTILKEILAGGISGDTAAAIAHEANGPGITAPAGQIDTANKKWSAGTNADPVDPGLYLVVITTNEPAVLYNPVFVASNWYVDGQPEPTENTFSIVPEQLEYSDEAYAKLTSFGVDKEHTGVPSSETNNPNDDTDSNTVDVGDTVEFTVKTTIPYFASNYTKPVFNVQDTLKGLDLIQNSITVYASQPATAGTELTENTEYIVTGKSAAGYTVEFQQTYLQGQNFPAAGQPITIKYRAIVNDTALLTVNQEENTVDLIFSTEPSDEKGMGRLRDKTNHFDFSIDANILGHTEESSHELIKVGKSADGTDILAPVNYYYGSTHNPLEGALFKLYRDQACTDLYTNTQFNGEVTSDASGRLTIKGLDVGDYYLKEVSAPQGFIKSANIVKITITANIGQNKKIVETIEVDDATGTKIPVEVTYYTNYLIDYAVAFTKIKPDGTTAGGATTTYTVENDSVGTSDKAVSVIRHDDSDDEEIVNTKGTELPSTGGIGTTLFYAIGAVLVLGAGILLVTKRRMSAY